MGYINYYWGYLGMTNGDYGVKSANSYVTGYEQYGQKVLEDCKKILNRAGVTVPVGQNKDDKKDKPITGFELEHQQDDPVPAEEPKAEDKKSKKVTSSSSDDSSDATVHTSTINETFTKLNATENRLNSKTQLTSFENEGLSAVSDFVDQMEDIEDAGQNHIDALTAKYPENGVVSGTTFASYENSTYGTTDTFLANVSNSWQSKDKSFVINGSATFGIENTRLSRNTTDLFFDESGSSSDTDADDAIPEEVIDEIKDEISDELTTTQRKVTGGVSLSFRLDGKKMIYGGGVKSNFYTDGSQIHDQNLTVGFKESDIAGDLTRRMVVSADPESGERITSSKMKLKINIINRNNQQDETEETETTDATQSIDAAQDTDTADNDNNNNNAEPQDNVSQNGKGWNVDFKYDDSVCGFSAEHGFKVINKPKTELTIAPAFGAFDYNDPTGETNESLKCTAGAIVDFRKEWGSGHVIEAQGAAIGSRVVQSGSRPSDFGYLTLSGEYNSPKKTVKVKLDSGIIKVPQISMKYAQVNADVAVKNGNIGIQAGYQKFNSPNLSFDDWKVAAKYTYNIPYGKKK